MADYTFVRKGHVTIKVGDVEDPQVNSGVQTDVHDLGCVTGDFTVNDSFNEETAEEFDNWCAHIAAEEDPGSALEQVNLGQRVIEFTVDLELDLSDADYKTEYDAYTSKTPRQFQISFTNEGGDEQELVINGLYTAWNRTARDGDGGAGTARVSVSFHANEVVKDDITTSGTSS